MKITKKELIELEACKGGLNRFITQTNNTDEPVEVSTLIGGKNYYSDLLWLAGKKLPKERIARFACDCALLNIVLIKPYTDKYDMIVEFLHNPVGGGAAWDAADAADEAIDAADEADDNAAFAAANAADNAACANAATSTVTAYTAAEAAAYTAFHAADAACDAAVAGDEEKVNKLLKELFA